MSTRNVQEKENELIASGRIVHIKRYDNGATFMVLFTKSGTGKRDVLLKMIVPKGIHMPEDMSVGMNVSVVGHRIGFSNQTRDGKWKNVENFVADSVTKTETVIKKEFGVEGNYPDKMDTSYKVMGAVAGVREKDGWYYYTIRTDGAGTARPVSHVHISCKKNSRFPAIEKGDNVCAICSISTPKKSKGDKTIYYEDVVVLDIAKI